MVTRKDPARIALAVLAYAVMYYGISYYVFVPLLYWAGGLLVAGTVGLLLSAGFANWLALRIFEDRSLPAVGLPLNRGAADNLGFGLLGGVGAACLVLVPALLVGAAHWTRSAEQPSSGALPFVTLLLIVGAVGEEMLFRGYGFQILLAAFGPYATILPVSILFALLHGGNPNATWFGLANTAGFGVLFGYAFLRSRDLWLPIGLHFGWNFTLPLFGANLSGLTMRVTGHEMAWTAGKLWSGGDYGPEASILTSVVLVLLFVYVWKAPLRRQHSALTDPPVENA
jgi:membrane protease YdiL (CAAX protease family)